MVKLSVVVPVYNVEKYLPKCLDSLVTQTLKNIEIIIINDGTKDSSQKIIEKYSKKYPKIIKYYIKENGGLSSARNEGLKYSTGDYVAFVDSDDFVEKTMFEKMYNKAKSADYDMVVCDVKYIYDNAKKNFVCSSKIYKDINDKKEVKKSMLDFYPVAWNKIFKRKLLQNIAFKDKIWFEDVEFLYRLMPRINSIGVIKEPLYNYVQRQGSITSSVDKRIYNYIDNWNGLIKFYKENNLYEEYKKILEFCYVRYIYGTFIKSASKYEKKEFDKAVNIAIKNVKQKFPKYRKNKYFYRNLKGIYLVVFNKIFVNLVYFFINKKR